MQNALNLRGHAPCTKRQKRSHVTIHAFGNKSTQPSVAVPLPASQTIPSSTADNAIPPHFAAALGAAAAVAAVALWNKNVKTFFFDKKKLPTQIDNILDGANAPENSKEYRMALARTRQAVAVHKAIGFMNTGNPSRSMVEVRRALHENSVCRSPILNSQWEKNDLQGLYRLHLQNAPVPADFATLLQLRTLLDLDFDEAERIESELMSQGSAYSI